MSTEPAMIMSEPPDGALVAVVIDDDVDFVYQRDDRSAKESDMGENRWYAVGDDVADPDSWADICEFEVKRGQLVRLYREGEDRDG